MKLLSLTACLVLALAGLALAQSNVAPAQKFGGQENTGWMNWRDANGTTQGVVIGSMFLRGFAWGENVGWLNLDDASKFVGLDCPDTDGDGTLNCRDGCPNDPLKVAPGICGCGVADTDTDLDGVADCLDNCDAIANPGYADCDSDGVGNVCELAAGTQWDTNGNGAPDQCEACPNVISHCTAGTTTNGCTATMSATGTPSLAAAAGFVLRATGVEGQKTGLLFYGIFGPNNAAWAPGSSSRLCARSPVQRLSSSSTGGTANLCNGVIAQDSRAYLAAHPGSLGQPFAPGVVVNAQAWLRDPPAPGMTNLSNGLQFTMCP